MRINEYSVGLWISAMYKKSNFIHNFLFISIPIIAVLLSAYFAISDAGNITTSGHTTRSSYLNPEKLPPSGDFHGYVDEDLSIGKLLVANEKVRDPRFMRTVILLVNYGYRGAAGLIVNHPIDMKLSHVLPKVKGIGKSNEKLYFGGPVGMNQITMLIQSENEPEESGKIFDHIYGSKSLALLEQMIEKKKPDEKFRLYVGYAGWAPGQLESEIARGDWRILKGTPDIVFNNAPDQIWRKLVPQNMSI
jgi:putative transcriptional regulator